MTLLAAYMVLAGPRLAFFGLMSLGATGFSWWLVSTEVGVLVCWDPLAWRIWLGLPWLRARVAKLGSAGDGAAWASTDTSRQRWHRRLSGISPRSAVAPRSSE